MTSKNRVVLSCAQSCALCGFTPFWSREWRCDSGKLLYSNAQIPAWVNGARERRVTQGCEFAIKGEKKKFLSVLGNLQRGWQSKPLS